MRSVAKARLAVMACAVLGALVLAAPAAATFPGGNGAIAFSRVITSGGIGPEVEQRRLMAVRLRCEPRTLIECVLSEGAPSGGNCTVMAHGGPSCAPDGGRIVFDAGARLAVMNADGSGLTLLPATTPDDGEPAFSPDGERVVFSGSNDRHTRDLYVRGLDGGDARLIVQDAKAPAWSVRNAIAYVRSGNVYVARPTGGHRRWVSSGVSPDWSPDGRRLVLVRPLPRLTFDAPTGRMYTVSTSGLGLRRVGRTLDAADPVWSPNGNWIAFDRVNAGVFARRLGRRRPAVEVARTQISGESGSVVSSQPAWRPLR